MDFCVNVREEFQRPDRTVLSHTGVDHLFEVTASERQVIHCDGISRCFLIQRNYCCALSEIIPKPIWEPEDFGFASI
jgi:hypothetical protein